MPIFRTFRTTFTEQLPIILRQLTPPLLITVLSVIPLLTLAEDTTTTDTTPAATAQVVVIGAGIAGLTAAYFLKDCDLKVLEQTDQVGGRTKSGNYQGFTYAKGTEYLGKPEGALAKLVTDLKLSPKEIPAPMDAHFYGDKFYYGSDGLALMYLEQSSIEEYNRFVKTIQDYAADYDEIPEFDLNSPLAKLDNLTVRQWFDQEKFPAIFYETYNVAARGLFGANIDEISALSFIPEISFDYEGDEPIATTAVAELDNSPDTESGESTDSYSFFTGITEVTTALGQELKNQLQLNATVTSVTQRNNLYWISYQDKTGLTQSLTAKVVVLAVPAPVALTLAPTILSEEQKRILQQIPYASYLTVAVFSKTPIFNQAFDLAVPNGYFFTDVYDSTRVQRHEDVSLAHQTDYIASVYVAPNSYQDQSLLKLTDEEILNKVYTDLEKLFPGAKDKVLGYDLQRFNYAYPVMTIGAYQRLTRLHEITTGNLLLAGDYTIYPTFEAAVESGYLAAQKAMATLGNECRVKPTATINSTATEIPAAITTATGLKGNHLSLKPSEEATITAIISVAPEHVGTAAELFATAFFFPKDAPGALVFSREADKWKLWNGQLSNLAVMASKSQLSKTETFKLHQGNFQGFPGNFLILIGYRLPDGKLIYQPEPIEFKVEEK